MAYDPYKESATDQWDFMAQVAIWRERAMHQAERAERWKRIAENAAKVPVKVQDPGSLATVHQTTEGH